MDKYSILRKKIQEILKENYATFTDDYDDGEFSDYNPTGMNFDFDEKEFMGPAKQAAKRDMEKSGEKFQELGQAKEDKNLDINQLLKDLNKAKQGKTGYPLQAIQKQIDHLQRFGAGSLNEDDDNIEQNIQEFSGVEGKKFYYHINMDERGEFYADVRDENDKTIFEIKGFEFFEDGFMKNKEDMFGLKEYLVDYKIMKWNDDLVNTENNKIYEGDIDDVHDNIVEGESSSGIAHLVTDDNFNQAYFPDLIGKIFRNKPSYASTKEVSDSDGEVYDSVAEYESQNHGLDEEIDNLAPQKKFYLFGEKGITDRFYCGNIYERNPEAIIKYHGQPMSFEECEKEQLCRVFDTREEAEEFSKYEEEAMENSDNYARRAEHDEEIFGQEGVDNTMDDYMYENSLNESEDKQPKESDSENDLKTLKSQTPNEKVFYVIDNQYNREYYPELIGKTYDDAPGMAATEVVFKSTTDGKISKAPKKAEKITASNKNTINENKLPFPKQGTPAWHQLQIARKTIKMTDVGAAIMGGQTKDEAKKILAKYGLLKSMSESMSEAEQGTILRPKDANGNDIKLNSRVKDPITQAIGRVQNMGDDGKGQLTIHVAWKGDFGKEIPKSIKYPNEIEVLEQPVDEGAGRSLVDGRGTNEKPSNFPDSRRGGRLNENDEKAVRKMIRKKLAESVEQNLGTMDWDDLYELAKQEPYKSKIKKMLLQIFQDEKVKGLVGDHYWWADGSNGVINFSHFNHFVNDIGYKSFADKPELIMSGNIEALKQHILHNYASQEGSKMGSGYARFEKYPYDPNDEFSW